MKKEKEEGEHVRLQVRKITEIRHFLSTVYQQTFLGGGIGWNCLGYKLEARNKAARANRRV